MRARSPVRLPRPAVIGLLVVPEDHAHPCDLHGAGEIGLRPINRGIQVRDELFIGQFVFDLRRREPVGVGGVFVGGDESEIASITIV